MKRFQDAIRRAPKLSGLAVVLAGVFLIPATLLAWGPDRPTYTMEKPASHVTFNSITNNPKHGDERNFVQIRNLTDNDKFGENTKLEPGKEYEVYVYYHNNASDNLNSEKHSQKGVALNSYMKVQMPKTVKANDKARITGTVGASNAQPKAVWDEAYGDNSTNGTVALRYVPNSAKVTSTGAVNGSSIDLDKLASDSGASLGYDALDGKLPGCMKYSGYVTYRFKVDQPNFEVKKEVSQADKNDFKDKLDAKAGEEVDFRIHYKNTGTMTQENVSIRDDLPKGLNLVDGSAKYFSSKTDGKWKTISDSDALLTSGVDFGSFGANGGMYVAFKARVADADKLECGKNTLVNTGVVTTKNGTKNDKATVTVEKDCEETEPKTVEVCEVATGNTVTVSEDKANDEAYASVDSEACANPAPETPETPSKEPSLPDELPQTGMAKVVSSVLGLGSLTAATYYFVTSRRS